MKVFAIQVLDGAAPIGFLFHDPQFDSFYVRTGEFAAFFANP